MRPVITLEANGYYIQWNDDLDIEALEAKGHWATLEELLEAVAQHLPRYESVLKACKEKQSSTTPLDLSFATKSLAFYLFIKVKASRPMTYQHLTIDMADKAKTNGRFIDQKMFKTAAKYGFGSIYLTDTNMQVLDGYTSHIRPRLKPTCDYVLVTRNGGQHSKLGESMGKLVFDSTAKYVHPTRFRQIVETESSKSLRSTAQSTISEDQKHSCAVAKMHYQKQRTREVAAKAHTFLKELQGDKGSEIDEVVRASLLDKSASTQGQNKKSDTSSTEELDSEKEVPTPEHPANIPQLKREKALRLKPPSSQRRKNIPFSAQEDK